MKITIYELIRMIKDGKAPKTIKSEGHYYNYNELEKDYYEGMGYDYEYLLANTSVKGLDDEIEIIEDTVKEKKIPEKISINDNGTIGFPNGQWTATNMNKAFAMNINSIIDYLKSKGE